MGMPERGAAGGPAACEPPFIKALRSSGHIVDEETYVFADPAGGARLAGRANRVLGTARRLRGRLNAERFDVLHLNTSYDLKAVLRDVFTAGLLSSNRTKLFLKFHGSDAALLQSQNPLIRKLSQRLLRRADGIGVLSEEEKLNFLGAGVDPKKIFLVKNAVAAPALTDGDDVAQGRIPSGATPLLLYIARFIPAKGLTDVVRATAILRDRGYSFTLYCVGDGPARAEAESLTDQLELRDRVHFTGYVSEQEASVFYGKCSVLVFPTYHFEGFPMVIFNAVAAGKPIITTRIRAAADYLSESENCLWVEPRNPPMLAEKIATLLDDKDLATRISINNRELAKRFAAGVVAAEYAEVYGKLISR
jgi:glycosyltransferase involved in cell wall biosynthesis